MTYAHELERFNRASFGPPTPELAPAESIQPVEITGSHCWAVIPIGFVLVVILTVIGANTL